MAAATVRASALVLLAVMAPAFALPLSALGPGLEALCLALVSLALSLSLIRSLPSVAWFLLAVLALFLATATMLALSLFGLAILALLACLAARLPLVGVPGLSVGRSMDGAGRLATFCCLEGKDSLAICGAVPCKPLGFVSALPPSL